MHRDIHVFSLKFIVSFDYINLVNAILFYRQSKRRYTGTEITEQMHHTMHVDVGNEWKGIFQSRSSICRSCMQLTRSYIMH